MFQVLAELTARKESDDQLDLRIHARRVSHRETPEIIGSGNLDVNELAGCESHLRRVDKTKRDSAYRRSQICDTLHDGLEGLDLIASEELLLRQAHRGDVDDAVREGPARTHQGPACRALGVAQCEA